MVATRTARRRGRSPRYPTLLRHPGGQALVVVIGLAFIGGGLYLAYKAWRKQFRQELQLGHMRAVTRRVVEWLGEYGGIVFVTAGVFLVIASSLLPTAADRAPQRVPEL